MSIKIYGLKVTEEIYPREIDGKKEIIRLASLGRALYGRGGCLDDYAVVLENSFNYTEDCYKSFDWHNVDFVVLKEGFTSEWVDKMRVKEKKEIMREVQKHSFDSWDKHFCLIPRPLGPLGLSGWAWLTWVYKDDFGGVNIYQPIPKNHKCGCE